MQISWYNFFLFFAPHSLFSLQAKLTDDKSSMSMKSSEALKEIQDCMFNFLFYIVMLMMHAHFR